MEPRQYSEPNISERLDSLISAWHEVHLLANRADRYPQETPYPEPPNLFENAEQLARFANALEHYNQGLRQINERKEAAAQRFEDAKERVAEVLPPGTSVMHPYGGPNTELSPELSRRERHRISHEVHESTSDATAPDPQIRVGVGDGEPPTEPKLNKVVSITQQSSTAGITITLGPLEIYEGGHSLIGYSVSPTPEAEEDLPLRYSFPEVRVRDDRGRSYEAGVRNAARGRGGKLWVADLPGVDAAELEVEVVRLFKGPSGEGRSEYLGGPWVFRFPL